MQEEPGEPTGLVVFAAASDLTLGSNRIQFVVRTLDGESVGDSSANLRVVYSRPDSEAEPRTVDELEWHDWPVRGGAYTARLDFDSAGNWQLRVSDISRPGSLDGVAALLVRETSVAPAIGDRPPPTPSKTGMTAAELALITSDIDPDPRLYEIGFDDAIESGDPTVVVFSTPAYCQSATCGPQVDAISEVRDRYAGPAHFIHVELFDNPAEMRATGDISVGVESPLVESWRLPSEPWTFVIGRDGKISARFEAFTTADEIKAALLEADATTTPAY